MLAKYQAVIFDFDDTLVKTIEPIWAHHKYTAKRFYGLELTDETLHKYYGMPFDEMIQLLYEHKDSLDNMKANYHSCYTEEFYKQPHEGSLEVVTALLEQGKHVGILTSTLRQHMDFDLERLGFPHDRFVLIQTQEDTDFHKPDPRVFEPTLEKLAGQGITNLETIYIGDAIRDFVAARDAGIGFIGVTNGLTSVQEFRAAGAEVVTDLPSLLNST